jgi:hypothetical protein
MASIFFQLGLGLNPASLLSSESKEIKKLVGVDQQCICGGTKPGAVKVLCS